MTDKTPQQRIEECLMRGVGEDIMVPCPKEWDCPMCERGLQRKCQTAEHNQDMNDLRDDIKSRIPSVAREVLEIVREEVLALLKEHENETLWGDEDSNEVMRESIKHYQEAIIASLVGDGDNRECPNFDCEDGIDHSENGESPCRICNKSLPANKDDHEHK